MILDPRTGRPMMGEHASNGASENHDVVLVPMPRQIASQAEAQAVNDAISRLVTAAGRDNHRVLGVTHIMMRDGEPVGYFSLSGTPMVHSWFSSQIKNPRHSKEMIAQAEVVLRERGVTHYHAACAEDSPFNAHMERLGFTKLGTTVIWEKSLKGVI